MREAGANGESTRVWMRTVTMAAKANRRRNVFQ
jgi:hypothetical protein